MGYIFNGTEKIITLTSGTTLLDVRDMYSRWKEWFLLQGSNYLQTFQVIGGEPIDETNGIYITSYFFLGNGWKVRPQEANHKLVVTNGILLTIEGTDPFLQTIGAYNVMVQYSQPIKSETVSTGGGTPDSIAIAVWNEAIIDHTAAGSFGKIVQDTEKKVDDNTALVVAGL